MAFVAISVQACWGVLDMSVSESDKIMVIELPTFVAGASADPRNRRQAAQRRCSTPRSMWSFVPDGGGVIFRNVAGAHVVCMVSVERLS